MPTYSMKNTETGEIFTVSLKIAEREEYLLENPNIIQIFNKAPALGDSVRLGLRKPDSGFRDVLKKAQIHRGNTINTF